MGQSGAVKRPRGQLPQGQVPSWTPREGPSQSEAPLPPPLCPRGSLLGLERTGAPGCLWSGRSAPSALPRSPHRPSLHGVLPALLRGLCSPRGRWCPNAGQAWRPGNKQAAAPENSRNGASWESATGGRRARSCPRLGAASPGGDGGLHPHGNPRLTPRPSELDTRLRTWES